MVEGNTRTHKHTHTHTHTHTQTHKKAANTEASVSYGDQSIDKLCKSVSSSSSGILF